MTQPSPSELASIYLEAWPQSDFDRIRSILTDDTTFRGPLGTANGIEECLAGLQGLARIIDRIDIQRMVEDGDDVMTWYDLATSVADPVPTVNWSRVRDGRIAAIQVVFDPRPLLDGMG